LPHDPDRRAVVRRAAQIVLPARATAQTIVSNDWEDGTLQGYATRKRDVD
jgi:hypothetical protein